MAARTLPGSCYALSFRKLWHGVRSPRVVMPPSGCSDQPASKRSPSYHFSIDRADANATPTSCKVSNPASGRPFRAAFPIDDAKQTGNSMGVILAFARVGKVLSTSGRHSIPAATQCQRQKRRWQVDDDRLADVCQDCKWFGANTMDLCVFLERCHRGMQKVGKWQLLSGCFDKISRF